MIFFEKRGSWKSLFFQSAFFFSKFSFLLHSHDSQLKLSWDFDDYPSHCLDQDLNDHLTRRNFWWVPGMLETYTIPKWKEFLKSREPILRKSFLSTFIHINKHMDGARGTLWKKSWWTIVYYIKWIYLVQKNFDFHAWVKKCHFGNFLLIYVDKSG